MRSTWLRDSRASKKPKLKMIERGREAAEDLKPQEQRQEDWEKKARKIRGERTSTHQTSLIKAEAALRKWEKLHQLFLSSEPRRRWLSSWQRGNSHLKPNGNGLEVQNTKGSTLLGLPRWAGGKEPTCQCRRPKRHRFDPRVRKIPWRRAWQSTLIFVPG